MYLYLVFFLSPYRGKRIECTVWNECRTNSIVDVDLSIKERIDENIKKAPWGKSLVQTFRVSIRFTVNERTASRTCWTKEINAKTVQKKYI